MVILFLSYCYGDHLDLHVRTHSFPTRRSSDLIFIASTPGETPAGSCGHPVPGYEACVLDAAGLPLDSGTGRLAVRGPTGCRYLGDVRQNDYVIDGWNVTGDTYRIDEAGNFWFVARSEIGRAHV